MKKHLLSFVLGLAVAAQVSAQAKWNVDASHSSISFNVSHLVISEVTGQFKKFDASVTADKADFTDAKINFSADVNSVNTDNEQRDGHLKGDDFFNAEKYPQLKFVGSSLKKVSGNKYKLTGDLTIRDVTKKVTFDVVYGGTVTDPYKNIKAGFKIIGKINRKEYGLKWSALTEAGGAVVGDEVELVAKIELTKAK